MKFREIPCLNSRASLLDFSRFEYCWPISDDPANICEHTLTNESGWIVAPGYENDGFYENSLDCIWNITAPDYFVIQFRIHFIDIESSIRCVKDHLMVS